MKVFDRIYGERITKVEIVVTVLAFAGWLFLIVSQ